MEKKLGGTIVGSAFGFGDKIPGNCPVLLSISIPSTNPTPPPSSKPCCFLPSGDLFVFSIEAKRAAGDIAPPLSWNGRAEVEGEEFGPVKRWTRDMNSLGSAWIILGETVYIITGGAWEGWWLGGAWCAACCGAIGGFLILWESLRTLSGAGRGPCSSRLGDRPSEKSMAAVEWERWYMIRNDGSLNSIFGWFCYQGKCLYWVLGWIYNMSEGLLVNGVYMGIIYMLENIK